MSPPSKPLPAAGVLDSGVADHRQELLQAARPRGPAVRLRGPADHDDHGDDAAPPDRRAEHRPPGALADGGADHQQPRRNGVAHPGTSAQMWLRPPSGCIKVPIGFPFHDVVDPFSGRHRSHSRHAG